MIITKVKLIGYTRIQQNLIETIEIDFNKAIQIIIGSNGSGKSSLKEQLSPLPPASGDFIKGGRKEFYCTHGNSKYVCISDFGNQSGHYFEKDGRVLNNWGTALVQKALIEQEFSLTQDIFDVISGAKKFTDMNPTDRRDWVMFLSRIDINPLMSIFMEAKNKQRDAKAYLVKITERLKIEEKNKTDPKVIEELTENLKSLKEEFNYYSQFSEELIAPTGIDLKQKSAELIDFMESLFDQIPKVPSRILKHGVTDLPSLKELIIATNARLLTLKAQYEELMGQLKDINKVAEATALLSHQGIGEIEAKIKQLTSELNNTRYKLSMVADGYGLNLTNPKQAKLDFLRINLELRTQLFDIPNNEGLKFNSQTLNTTRAQEEGLLNRLTQVNNTIFKKEHQIKHIDESQEIACPECTYTFKQGVGKDDREILVSEVHNLYGQKAQLEQDLVQLKEYIKDCTEFTDAIRSIYNTMKLTPSNEPLWVLIREQEIFKNPTFKAIELLDQHIDALELAIQAEEINDLLEKENDILSKARESMEIIEKTNTTSVSKIDEKVYSLSITIEGLEKLSKDADLVYSRMTHAMRQIEKLGANFDDFNIAYFKELDRDRAQFIKDTKYNIMKEVNFIEQELEQTRVKDAIFRDVESELANATKTHEEYTTIVKNISPNTGLIADLMNESINGFVALLNALIASVWTSELVVHPCVNKRNDLDWKFPVKVDNDAIRPDVSKTSTSQTDIINFSFQRALCSHLGAENYPIFADELGSSMDDQHRINMMHILSDLVESNQCSQMFLISHFAAFHEQFTNNDTLVLDSKNIINMPRTYNQHVKINEE